MASSPTFSRMKLINLTIVLEATLLLAATFWSQFSGMKLLALFTWKTSAALIGIAVGIGMAISAYGLLVLSRQLPWLKQLREMTDRLLIPLVQELKPLDMVLISILSGFCEEVFFRGVVQRQLGLVITSIAFGLLHDPTFSNVSYSLLTCIYGLVLGYLFLMTGNIWAPILAHATHNLITLLVLRYWEKPPASAVGQG
jgi:uncharacterized protein